MQGKSKIDTLAQRLQEKSMVAMAMASLCARIMPYAYRTIPYHTIPYHTDVSICYQIINRPGEEIAATDGAEHVLNGACDLHRSISIYKKRALKT